MVTLNKIYTRTVDNGETGLGDGTRVPKYSLRVDSYGSVDETNATVGLARLYSHGEMDVRLGAIQNDLFDLGADMCRPNIDLDASVEYAPLRMTQSQVDRLEREIDEMNQNLSALKSFVLPGGSKLSTYLHLCRTVFKSYSSSIGRLP